MEGFLAAWFWLAHLISTYLGISVLVMFWFRSNNVEEIEKKESYAGDIEDNLDGGLDDGLMVQLLAAEVAARSQFVAAASSLDFWP